MMRTRLILLLMACTLAVLTWAALTSLTLAEAPIGKLVAPPATSTADIVPPGKPTTLPLVIYTDDGTKSVYSMSGWMGNNKFYSMDTKSTDNPHSGKTCVRIQYTEPTEFGGVAWLDPHDDWGDKAGGYNLTGARCLAFWARGASGGEKVTFGYGLLADGGKKFRDSSGAKLEVELTKDWKQYAIPLADKNLTCIKSAFYWMYTAKGKMATFYFDDVAYVAVDVMPPPEAKPKEVRLYPFSIYGEGPDKPPYAPSGRVGAAGAVAMNLKCTDNPHADKFCIKAEFKQASGRGGIVWQDPAGDMGDKPGGYHFYNAGNLKFWARGDKGGEKVTFGYGLIGPDKKFADSASGILKDVALTTQWKQYSISVADKDLSCLKTPFYWIVEAADKPVTFYLDDIEYTGKESTPTTPTTPTSVTNRTIAPPAKSASGGSVQDAKLPMLVYGENTGGPYTPTGWMGNRKGISLDLACTERPYMGKNCIKVGYSELTEWGGIIWQNPANDWGELVGGYNLSAAKTLSFWARGSTGGEKVTFGYGRIGKEKPHPDSSMTALNEVELTTQWTHYTINLAGKDMSCIKSGFYWSAQAQGRPIVFYIDEIEYLATEP
jgi:hypothetical protein